MCDTHDDDDVFYLFLPNRFLSKRDFLACVGHAEDTEWVGSGVTFCVGDNELNEVDVTDPNWLDQLGFHELEHAVSQRTSLLSETYAHLISGSSQIHPW